VAGHVCGWKESRWARRQPGDAEPRRAAHGGIAGDDENVQLAAAGMSKARLAAARMELTATLRSPKEP
jgi:hypothetical protein